MSPSATLPGRARCRFCGAPLAPDQIPGAVCAAPDCERRRVQEASRAVFRRDWNDFVGRQRQAAEIARPGIARALRRLGAKPGEAAIGVVPHLDRAVVPLPPDRRAAFEARLDEIIAAAFAQPPPDSETCVRAHEEAEHPLITAACATCQGMCCTLGGPRHAFLEVSDIRRFRQRHPEADAAAVRAHYLGRLPERSVEHSCVYQSAAGCVLDRAERADICNRYHCNPQSNLLMRMREMQVEKAVIVGHEGEAGPVVAVFDRASGFERLGDAQGGEEAPEDTAAALDAALAQIPAPLPKPPPFVPPAARCEFCGAGLERRQAILNRCCGAPACAAARSQGLAREAAEREA